MKNDKHPGLVPLHGSSAVLRAVRVIRKPPGECIYCDTYRNEDMVPPHDPSLTCESGQRNHCTCCSCF